MLPFRYAFVALMLFSLVGVAESFAAGKPPKAKIIQQPRARTVELGQDVQLSVVFNSTTTAKCQWRHNKVPVPGATHTTYVIETVLPEDAGKYDVVITNGAGATTSQTVLLVVNLAPPSLPVDAVVHGDFTLRILGQTEQADGAYLVTGATTLQDPEAPADVYTFTYVRQPKDRAAMVIKGRFYDSELGGYITSQETLILAFTGVSSEGELLASVTSKGFFLPPAGYRPSKLNFTGKGTISIQVEASSVPTQNTSSAGTITLAGSGATMTTAGTVRTTNSGVLTLNNGGVVNTTSQGTVSTLGGTLSTDVAGTGSLTGALALNGTGTVTTPSLTGAGFNVFEGSSNTSGGVLILTGQEFSSIGVTGTFTSGELTFSSGSLQTVGQ